MAKDYSKVQRGQVFWFDPSVYSEEETFKLKGSEFETHCQREMRPWVVVSNNQNNDNAHTCNIVPITTEVKTPLPCHVYYTYGGKRQTILVEQMRTVDIISLQGYICTLSDSIMQKIEAAMIIQFAIRPSVSYLDITLNNVTTHLQEVIKKILEEQGAIMVDREEASKGIPISAIEDSALYLADTIENLVKKPTQPLIAQDEIVVPESSKKPLEPHKHTGGRSVSQEELQRRVQYIKDCNTMPAKEVSKKYNIPLDKILMYKHNWLRVLKRNGISIE